MPSNPNPEVADRTAILEALGLDSRLATTTAAAAKTTNILLSALECAGISAGSPSGAKASLVHTAVTKLGPSIGLPARDILLRAIKEERVTDVPHVEAASAWLVRFCKEKGTDSVPTQEEFDEAAGVGVVVTADDMQAAVAKALADVHEELVQKRYRFNTGVLQRQVMEKLRFAEGKTVNSLIRKGVEDILGPKTEQDMAKPPKVKKQKNKDKSAEASAQANGASKQTNQTLVNEPPADPFEAVPSRFDARDLKSAENTPELIELQKKMTGGKIVTRFPPEPNGYLHVGHAKAMFIDFGYAKKMDGECVLRFDDTNPVAEKTEYIDAIKEMVEWMTYKPTRVTFSSDYFEQLYDLAMELIRRGKAYICHQTGDEISRDRKEGIESPYRNREVDENMRLFSDMRKGKYGEGEATLRMKIDMQHANLAMRDPVAYRVIHSPHPHVGDKWCIYPSYDFTHCIVDSLEWITHSLCTLEFEVRRDSYYWLLEALDLYRPYVWESARLNLEHTVMSKRKLKHLVTEGVVRGWDDPRMPTLVGMRRRGYTPSALNRFCAAIGVSRSTNMIGLHVLEHWVRSEHDAQAPRVMAVLKPLRVSIRNFRKNVDGSDANEVCTAPIHPKDPSRGTRSICLTSTVYIEQSDFRSVDEKSYYGLAPGKTAMLRYAYPITVVEVRYDENNENPKPIELIVDMDYEKSVKPKGVLHWVGHEDTTPFEARLYNKLFKSADPSSLRDDWLDDVNPDSEVIIDGCLIEGGCKNMSVGSTVQFERTGYFTVDQDATFEKMVFNMTVSLRDSR